MPMILQHVVAIGDPRVDLDHGTRDRNLGHPRELRKSASSKPLRGPRTSEVGGAGQKLHALSELVDRCRADELHRVAERDAQRDRENRQKAACFVLRQGAVRIRLARR